MSLLEYHIKRSKHLNRIRTMRASGVALDFMLRNEQWILAKVRAAHFHPENLPSITQRSEHYVVRELLSI
jgi:hypothetical protein